MGALVRCLAWASAVLVELSALLILLCVGSAMGFECMLSKVHAARVRIAALTLHARSSVLGYLLLLFPPLALAALPDPSMRPCGKTGGAIVLLPAPSPELAHALAVALAANTQGDSGACLPAAGPWGVRALFQDVLTRFFPTPRRGNTVLVLVPDEVSLRALIPRWAQVKAAHNRTKSSPSPPSRGLVGVPDLLKGWRIGDEASSLKSEWSERSERSDSSPTSSPPRRHIGRVIPLLCTEKSEKSEYVQTLVQEYCDSHSLTLRGVVLLPPARIEDMQVARKLITTSKSRLVQLASGDHAGVKGATKVYINGQTRPPLDALVHQTSAAVARHWEDLRLAARGSGLSSRSGAGAGAGGVLDVIRSSAALAQDLANFFTSVAGLALHPPALLRPISASPDESDSSDGESWGKHTQPPLPEKVGVSDALLQLVREALYAPTPRDAYYLGWVTRLAFVAQS